MKNVMLLGGGTSTAWHIAYVLKTYFSDEVSLTVCDINEKHSVHTSVLADHYIQVPLIKSPDYYQTMLSYLEEYQIDVLIPLIDDDILLFSRDNPDLLSREVLSTAAVRQTFEMLSDKRNLTQTLNQLGVPAPRVCADPRKIHGGESYFVKAAVGCGSRGALKMTGEEILSLPPDDARIVQELCVGPEITVDVVLDGKHPYTVCRERMEIKLGVSTKCRIYHDPEIQHILESIAHQLALPELFCVQFMKNHSKQWVLTDFNLRSGGGTAISAAVGFEAVRFAAADWLGLERSTEWLQRPTHSRYVVRTYSEVVTE